jgi:mono/diheme cytochrome c family protein/cytochrome c553
MVNSKMLELASEFGQNEPMSLSHLGNPAPLLLVWLFLCCSVGFSQNPNDTVESAAASDPQRESKISFFENKIRPLLHEHCVSCHGPEKQEGGLRLDTPEAIVSGGESGAAVQAADVNASLILVAVRQLDTSLQMPPPPQAKLTDSAIADLTAWIEQGAVMPLASSDSDMSSKKKPKIGKEHWSFQPVQRPLVPQVVGEAWGHNTIDLFVQQSQEKVGVKRQVDAEKSIWLRRITFDLTGLPPTVEETIQFLSDSSEDADARVIERLLASPQYGVRWGRFWLDVVRYSDSNGLDENIAHGTAWRYRNYVIDSWNADKPYDRFVTEQLAGDLIPHQSRSERIANLTATAFLALGPKVLAEVDERKMEMDIIDEQIDTLGKAFLGMTFGCARCHDHKFDPVSMQDYYGLAGVFKSTHTMDSFTKIAKWYENEVATEQEEAERAAKQAEIAELTKRLESLAASGATEVEKKALTERLEALQKALPALPTVMGVKEGTVQDVPLHVRGNHLVLASKVERHFPEVLSLASPGTQLDSQKSGRLDLASWMTDRSHPLTARVIVNRLWRWHFGKGLVSSTDNFGALGDRPSHPELLDWLAAELIDSGWSIKHIQRLIVSSATYRQGGERNLDYEGVDPENRWLWRYPVRRLEAEAIRDFLLATCGEIDLARGTSLLHVGNREFLFDHTSIDKTNYDSHLRAVYLPVIRNHLYDLFDLFDYSDAATVQGDRGSTVVAPQALFMLNSALVHQSAKRLAEIVQGADLDSDAQRIDRLHLILYGRYASENERTSMLQFLDRDGEQKSIRWAYLCQAALASNDFMFVR